MTPTHLAATPTTRQNCLAYADSRLIYILQRPRDQWAHILLKEMSTHATPPKLLERSYRNNWIINTSLNHLFFGRHFRFFRKKSNISLLRRIFLNDWLVLLILHFILELGPQNQRRSLKFLENKG